jgi:hypothetical protein
MNGRPFTITDIEQILTNPVYVGIGAYARLIPDDVWIESGMNSEKELGVNFWLYVQGNLVKLWPDLENSIMYIIKIAQTDFPLSGKKALAKMLADLRTIAPVLDPVNPDDVLTDIPFGYQVKIVRRDRLN